MGDRGVDRRILQHVTEAYGLWKHELDQVRTGLPNTQAEDLMNLSTKVGQP
jgi:hypothetical protein